ncbi:MAG: hypothetical protein ACR2PB_00580 [Desulfocapsaceae bacterium]
MIFLSFLAMSEEFSRLGWTGSHIPRVEHVGNDRQALSDKITDHDLHRRMAWGSDQL